MSKLSNIIEDFIKDMLKSTEAGAVEIKRNELAQKFECAPSQINYVLTTRFTTDKGYYIESRRGGGGYIKIVKININDDSRIKNLVLNIIGSSLTVNKSRDIVKEFLSEGVVNDREYKLMNAALSSRLLQSLDSGNEIRADIMKNMLLALVERS
ncbi:transcriptional regulator CtsR [Andreesenia angusta]|uniref:Transcriptional regulator CtsR n=1 Tax=Andreesenia angusta TaxID=39480 RepID=A0A1S1V7A2_9FIRM|nr:CtsR family transcriptional regulator [Andreesenia angusta]OHW62384.1 transcriptional regulator CtsR [Andreesenia angusta]